MSVVVTVSHIYNCKWQVPQRECLLPHGVSSIDGSVINERDIRFMNAAVKQVSNFAFISMVI